MPDVGDRVLVQSKKVDQPPRDGVVTSVSGIKWSTGEETAMIPGPGAVTVVGKVRKSAGKKAAAPEKAGPKAKKSTQ